MSVFGSIENLKYNYPPDFSREIRMKYCSNESQEVDMKGTMWDIEKVEGSKSENGRLTLCSEHLWK